MSLFSFTVLTKFELSLSTEEGYPIQETPDVITVVGPKTLSRALFHEYAASEGESVHSYDLDHGPRRGSHSKS